jgi:hypothetical protein
MTIDMPKLVSLDIIDLNRRLRKRRKNITNLWDLLPNDVMPYIVTHKFNMDFNPKDNYNFNKLYIKYETKEGIIEKIYKDYKCKMSADVKRSIDWIDGFGEWNRLMMAEKAKCVFEIIKGKTNFDYLYYFTRYLKKEVFNKKFKVGSNYYTNLNNINTNENIKVGFTITEINDDILYVKLLDGDDKILRLPILFNLKKEDDENIYYDQYTKLYDEENYFKKNNLKSHNRKIIARIK